MPRFFIPSDHVSGSEIRIQEDMHHILHVLRLGIGDRLEVCDGRGHDYVVCLKRIEEDAILCDILSVRDSDSEPQIEITLFQGIPKGDKMEQIIQKGVETGISHFVPVMMKRSVPRYEGAKEERKIGRFNKIAEAAAKQSGRGRIPDVSMPVTVSQITAQMNQFDLFLIPYENEDQVMLKEALSAFEEIPRRIGILIGPEGGFDRDEIRELTSYDDRVQIVSLGKRILRTETAGLVAAVCVLYHYDQFSTTRISI